MIHKPVLTKEVLEYLDLKPGENVIDGTLGDAGHGIEILKKTAPNGVLLGIDWDAKQIENSRDVLRGEIERVLLVNDSYVNVKEIAEKMHVKPINGILLDLGLSSDQLEESKRGFSFRNDEPLDMRFSTKHEITAEKIVNEYNERELEKILEEFGEERFARAIAKEIVHQRKSKRIESTSQLVNIIEEAVPAKFHNGKIHVATRSFQALRIAVNGELDNIVEGLSKAFQTLSEGGRLVVISFHSLEDRIVKNFFKTLAQSSEGELLTKKPIIAGADEISENPRSRSAKLRAIRKK